MQGRLVRRGACDVEVLPADHPERRLCKLAADLRNLVRERKPEGFREQRVAGKDGDRLSVLRPHRRPAPPLGVVVERGQIVVHERERVNELERRRGWQAGLRVSASGLDRRQANHRTHSFPTDERVAHGFRLPVQLRCQRQVPEVPLDERPQLLRAPHRSRRSA